MCRVTRDLTTSQKESSESFEAHRLEDHTDEGDSDSDHTDEEAGELTSHSDNFTMSVED